jgi:hypothetical protein
MNAACGVTNALEFTVLSYLRLRVATIGLTGLLIGFIGCDDGAVGGVVFV